MISLVGLAAETVMRPGGSWPATPIDGLALVAPEALASVPAGAPRFRALPDGNRAALLPDVTVEHAGRRWIVSVKGIGAQTPLFGDELGPRRVHAESWMGEAPFGGQGELGAATAIEVTSRAAAGQLGGAAICPVIGVVRVPDAAIDRSSFWYRRHTGAILAEHRLVPSAVRVYHGSACTLGRDPFDALATLGVTDVPALDAFVDRYLASAVALLTLAVRSACERDGEWVGLDYDDGWLDKDGIVAPDGTLHFADLETLDFRPLTPARITRQIGRNHYEVFSTLDRLFDVRDAWTARATDRRTRRESAVARLELALTRDRFVQATTHDDGLDLVVRSPRGPEMTVRFVDRR